TTHDVIHLPDAFVFLASTLFEYPGNEIVEVVTLQNRFCSTRKLGIGEDIIGKRLLPIPCCHSHVVKLSLCLRVIAKFLARHIQRIFAGWRRASATTVSRLRRRMIRLRSRMFRLWM